MIDLEARVAALEGSAVDASGFDARLDALEAAGTVLGASQADNVRSTVVTPAGDPETLAIVPCPTLVPTVTKMMFICSVTFKPLTGCTQVVPVIHECDSSGAVVLGNIGFWPLDNPVVDKWQQFAANWLYDPRTAGSAHVADVNLGTGSGKYLGFGIDSVGGNVECTSAILQVFWGPIPSISIDEDSTDLLDDSPGL